MALKHKINMIYNSLGYSSRDMAQALDVAPQTAANRLSRGITNINDIIKICAYCGASLTVNTKDGTIIPLTIEDIDEKK